ncbi:MAG: hypothetical protein SWQ30_06840 [Thermodesulfobacteriota bacterium]|nr:hypothetical protein [Thermodesulfobacteriota bacterium]
MPHKAYAYGGLTKDGFVLEDTGLHFSTENGVYHLYTRRDIPSFRYNTVYRVHGETVGEGELPYGSAGSFWAYDFEVVSFDTVKSYSEDDVRLMELLESGKTQQAAALVRKGADVQARKAFSYETPLHLIFKKYSTKPGTEVTSEPVELARLLLEKGAKVDARTRRAEEPLRSCFNTQRRTKEKQHRCTKL